MLWLWLILAFVLLFLEFYLPGGISLAIGTIFFILALIQAYQFFGPVAAVIMFFGILIGVVIVVKVALKTLQSRSKDNTFLLESDQEGFEGVEREKELTGKRGEADSDLKPSGYIVIEGKRKQAICQGRYIEKGERVLVIESRGGYVIVKPINGG